MNEEIKHLLKDEKEFSHPDTGTIILLLIIGIAILVGSNVMNLIKGVLTGGGILVIHLLFVSFQHTKKKGFVY